MTGARPRVSGSSEYVLRSLTGVRPRVSGPSEYVLRSLTGGARPRVSGSNEYVLGTLCLPAGAEAALIVTFRPRDVGRCSGLLLLSVNYNAFQRQAVRLDGTERTAYPWWGAGPALSDHRPLYDIHRAHRPLYDMEIIHLCMPSLPVVTFIS